MNGVTGHVPPVAPVRTTVGSRLHDIVAGFLQVFETMLKHFVGRALLNRLHLAVILVGTSGVGHVAECTYQIEVAERAKGQHLGTYHLIVALCEFGVFLHHLRGVVQHDITVVDNLIEVLPVVVPVGRQQVDSCDVLECVVVVVLQLHNLVRTEGTPHNGSFLNAVVDHAQVAAVNHLVDIGPLFPEVLVHDAVGGVDGQKVVAGREQCDSAATEQTFENIVLYLGNHNFQFSVFNFQLRSESYLDVQCY